MPIKLSKLKLNPKNPRTIKKHKFEQLVLNLLKYPKFLLKRPIVHKDYIAQGGNMRLQAIKHISKMDETEFRAVIHSNKIDMDAHALWNDIRAKKEVPDGWLANADDYDEAELKAFTIIDNNHAGDNDWDMLASEWEAKDLEAWGVDAGAWKEGNEDLLDTEPEKKTVSFEASSRPSSSDNEHSVYEQIMKHDNKKLLLEVLNQVKDKNGFDTLEQALMEIVTYYKKHNTK